MSSIINNEEIYKEIKDFPNYQISNFGNVKNIKTNRILKQRLRYDGYKDITLCINNKKYYKLAHRLVIEAFLDNVDSKPCCDHIDNNKENNNINNLRWATTKENNQNTKISKNNTSGVKGVDFKKASNKWRAHIRIDGIKIHLGLYDNIEDAKLARQNAAISAFKDFINKCELD